jgi:hypothetical protein
VAALVTVALVLSAALFRIRGVTGDLVPIIEYRFAAARVLPEAKEVAVAAAPTPEAPVTPIAAPGPQTATSLNAVQPEASPKAAAVAPTTDPADAPAAAKAQDHLDWPQYSDQDAWLWCLTWRWPPTGPPERRGCFGVSPLGRVGRASRWPEISR